MTRNQINELNMMDATNQVLTTFNSTWSGNTAISAMVLTFRSHLTTLNANDTLQKTISTGVTQTKEQAKQAMITAAVAAANAGKAYAAATGNTNLQAQMTVSKSAINAVADTDADDMCQNIHDNLNPYIANTAAYGATAATQTNLQNAITAFSNLIGAPRQQQAIVAHATITIAQHFSAVLALLKNQLDAAIAQYQTTNAPFYNEYMSARTIVDIGHRHTVTLNGFIYDHNSHALANATITLTTTTNARTQTHHKVTDATGKYKFTRLHTGTYTLTVSANGYVTQTKTVNATQNETYENDFELVVSGGGGTTNNNSAANTNAQ